MADVDFVQAKRLPGDGPVSVYRVNDERLKISSTTDGVEESITLSDYNASRVFGILALMLGIKLSNKLLKAIKM